MSETSTVERRDSSNNTEINHVNVTKVTVLFNLFSLVAIFIFIVCSTEDVYCLIYISVNKQSTTMFFKGSVNRSWPGYIY